MSPRDIFHRGQGEVICLTIRPEPLIVNTVFQNAAQTLDYLLLLVLGDETQL